MTLADVLALDENVIPIFLGFGLHCFGCPMSQMETLEEASMVHGIDCDMLVESLNKYFNNK